MRNASTVDKQRVSHCIVFLLINILVNPTPLFITKDENLMKNVNLNKQNNCNLNVQNENIRILYKFITLGLGGFIR